MERNEYLDYRQHTLKSASDQISRFGRALLFLSSGAIALSLLFLDKIGAQAPLTATCALVAAWAFLLLSLGSVVFSELLGFRAAHFDVKQIDEAYSRTKFTWKANPWNFWVELLNAGAGFFFCLGSILLVTFAYQNLGR